MISPQAKQAVQELCPDVSRTFVEDFFARMDEDYFSTFSPQDVATHIRMSSSLTSDRRLELRITPRSTQEFDIIIAGFDYPSQFSILCGLLSAFALDIRTGDIYSFARRGSRASSGRIVDVFRVSLKPGAIFDEARQREFQGELQTFASLLAAGSINEARERLNRFLTERIERMNEPLSGLRSPVELHFDNQTSPDWTVMNASSEDSFGFLYAISNALSMRGVYINKVKIRTSGPEARDQFFIADRWGRKIEEGPEQQRLRMAVAMITQFTSFLPEAPDPAKAMRHFDQLMDRIIEIGEEHTLDPTLAFLAGTQGMNTLAHLLGSSDFLWDDFLRKHFTEMVPIMENLALDPPSKATLREQLQALLLRAATFAEKKATLNEFKDKHLFLIDIKHLLTPKDNLIEFSHAITDLAELVLEEALQVCYSRLTETHSVPLQPDGQPCTFTICGLGKFGGREMGYASDLELLFVHDGADPAGFFEALARHIVDFIEARDRAIFHIDLRLRPHGDAGAWCASFDEFARYYSVGGSAAPFERQALIKLRWCAGDELLGRRVEAHRDSYTYSGIPWDWENAMHLRQRQIRELAGTEHINVKYGAGGIVDIEYAVQYLQLLNGREHPEVRLSTTLDALNRLRELQIVRESDYGVLHAGYLFLRNLIDALRIVRGDASDLVLPDEASEEFKSLARRLGYREQDRARGAALLAADIRKTMKDVHAYFVTRFLKDE